MGCMECSGGLPHGTLGVSLDVDYLVTWQSPDWEWGHTL